MSCTTQRITSENMAIFVDYYQALGYIGQLFYFRDHSKLKKSALVPHDRQYNGITLYNLVGTPTGNNSILCDDVYTTIADFMVYNGWLDDDETQFNILIDAWEQIDVAKSIVLDCLHNYPLSNGQTIQIISTPIETRRAINAY